MKTDIQIAQETKMELIKNVAARLDIQEDDLEFYGKYKAKFSDDGPGIPDDQKSRIFEMFYSGTNKIADSRRSLGLGLSLCKSIVTAHGGTISISDNQPKGATFTFTLPAGEVELNE